jgi:hypothetical protein
MDAGLRQVTMDPGSPSASQSIALRSSSPIVFDFIGAWEGIAAEEQPTLNDEENLLT